MSEYYDHFHRWEPLAEFQFKINDENNDKYDDDNYFYCLCSRAFIRDAMKTYYVEKENASESEVEILRESQSQEWEDQSHVHFSLDTSYKVKCEKDEGASCYCSASHTDNYCSTDEHDPAQIHGTASHALQPSDSGADLTYQDCHSDYTTHDKLEKMEQDFPNLPLADYDENYLGEVTWEKFWAINGERLIWASWINKYSDYINPSYLDDNNDLVMDENNIPKQHSADQIYNSEQSDMNQKLLDDDENLRERKFSYDSKVNPYKKSHKAQISTDKSQVENKDDTWLPLARKRSCSEHDRILSPRTVAGTDSMTNVTKITLSSYDVTSSHVTSESTPTDDYSISSSTSDDQNDQTRIANVEENLEQVLSDPPDTEDYWQFLWKKHFGEQYALHYANYVQSHDEKIKSEPKDLPEINIVHVPEQNVKIEEKTLEIEHENSEGNSQEMPTVIEVQAQVDSIKLDDKETKPKKRNKKNTNRIIGSVGMLLQTLLKEEQKKSELNEINEGEAGESKTDKTEPESTEEKDETSNLENASQVIQETKQTSNVPNDGDEDPPEEKSVSLKRSHEVDDEDEETSEKIKSTFDIMGFNVDSSKIPKGHLLYRKRMGRLRPPRYKRSWLSRKTYFDDDGNAYQPQESNDERYTDDDCAEAKSDNDASELLDTNEICNLNVEQEHKQAIEADSETGDTKDEQTPIDMDSSINSEQDKVEETVQQEEVVAEPFVFGATQVESTKRRRRGKRHNRANDETYTSEMPDELKDDPKMIKYWRKRHSLFHRFDEGIKLDRESWFSVTPESVAWHIANKFAYNVVLDAFCGAGGNTIQFARTCSKVIAIDIDPCKIEMARHNAGVYGVADRIEFIVGDFFELAPQLQADMVFLSPPWGGPKYSENYEYDLETMLEPKPASVLMDAARTISPNIALYVPRNTKSDQLLSLAQEMGGSLEVEQSYLDRRFVAITAYFY